MKEVVGQTRTSGASVQSMKAAFEASLPMVKESVVLTFEGVEKGYDVYNCSIPFAWKGVRHIFGRVEPHDKWASSRTMLFRESGKDQWTRVLEFGTLEIEDPFVQMVGGELVVGGTRVTKVAGEIVDYRGAFYRDHGKGPMHLEYFTTGPKMMKDIRLVEISPGRIGVFTRPRGEDVRAKYGSESVVGYTEIANLNDLTPSTIESVPIIEGVFGKDEWGGCNQAYLRPDGKVLVAGHLCCLGDVASNGKPRQIYCNAAFLFDPETRKASHIRLVATRRMYPAMEPKVPHLDDCVFTSGFEFLPDGSVDVYTGLCDAAEGRVRLGEGIGL
ncbi:MAG: DUF1861 family protein [Kiritimatiellia bacterium]|jgi:hypothetical protein